MRNDKRGVVFRQSLHDFPCPVALGKYAPSFGLHRYKQGLRFIPLDDEGFTVRGDKRRLLYRGRRRSHRFTVLGDSSFEYDCILEREPDSNVVSLLIDGAEHYDFFRQPDFVRDPFLKGSYAVYKKETLTGEGTGKLCHIHRPLIIDARGRRVWGALAAAGNILHITIPEKWLSNAKYPVIVDPTIGTTAVGSQTMIDPPDPFYFNIAIPVNRFLISETIIGLCTAYIYTDRNDNDAGGYPVFYSDNGNIPLSRISKEEVFADLRIDGSKPKGWRSVTLKSKTSIAAGSYIWFGVMADMWYPRFDYGAKCFCDFWDDYDGIPETYPIYNVNWYEDYKLSMYFTYTSAQNYVRTITQGVKLTDTGVLTGNYKRNCTQTAGVNSALSPFETFIRKCVMTAHISMNLNRLQVFYRKTVENIYVTVAHSSRRSISRNCADNVNACSEAYRKFGAVRKVQDIFKITDTQSFSMLFVRSVPDSVHVTHFFRQWGAFIRGLPVFAGSMAQITHNAEYYRYLSETVQAAGAVLRGLLLFVRIVTTLFVRDYLLRRFLIAREELKLKSVICREIMLDSKIV